MGNEASQEEASAPIVNKVEAKWTHVDLDGSIQPREGHTVVAHNNKLYIFGGGGGDTQFNELISVNLEDKVITKLHVTGTTPSGRTGAVAQVVDGKIWIIGGLSTASRGWVNDVYSFDIEQNQWTFVVPSGDRPSPRDKMASCLIGKKIYIFGGFGPRAKDKMRDDGEDEDEEEEDEEEEDEEGEEDEEEGGGKVPEFDWFGDVLVFNTETQTWATLPTTGTKPTPRCAAGVCALDNDNQIFVFGGRDAQQRKNDAYVLDLEKREWTQLNPRGRVPDPRSFHTCTRVESGVVLFGGMSINNAHFSDVHVLSHSKEDGKLVWLQPASVGTAPSARGFHTSTLVGGSVYVFGGSSGYDPELMCVTRFSNDVFKLEITEKL